MSLKINKKQIAFYLIFIVLFALAGVLQYIDNDLSMVPAKVCNLIANIIFFLLVFIWGYSINNRIAKKSIKIKLIIISLLIIFWFLLRYIKYECFNDNDIVSRYLWYLYYVPQCLVPPIALIAILQLTGKNNYKLNKVSYIIFLPSIILLILILTNDLHQLTFSFKHNFENFISDYKHGIIYYITMIWMILVVLSLLVILFFKCSVSSCRRKIWVPIIVFILSSLISFLCYFFAARSYKVPELISFSLIILIESCIYIGLIPSNKNYDKFFAVSDVFSVITDQNIKPIFYTNENFYLKANKYKEAVEKGNIFIDKNIRLSCKKICGGYVFYIDDFSNINKLLDELSILNEQLQEENQLIVYENKLKEKKAKIIQQNYLYSKIFYICNDTFLLINKLLENIDENDKNYKEALSIACVYLVYIKRRSNLEIISSQSKIIDICELSFAIKESLSYLFDCKIITSFTCINDIKINSKIAILLYEFFHECVKSSLPTLKEILISINFDGSNLGLRIVSLNGFSTINNFNSELMNQFKSKISIVQEDDYIYQNLSIDYKETNL